MHIRLSAEQQRVVYDILNMECWAPEHLRNEFMAYCSEETQNGKEFRFQGHLGFGGKIYINDRIYVSYYPEDKTPERDQMVGRANERLNAYFQKKEDECMRGFFNSQEEARTQGEKLREELGEDWTLNVQLLRPGHCYVLQKKNVAVYPSSKGGFSCIVSPLDTNLIVGGDWTSRGKNARGRGETAHEAIDGALAELMEYVDKQVKSLNALANTSLEASNS